MDERYIAITVFLMIVALALGVLLGSLITEHLITQDCVRFDAFYINGERYDCSADTEG